jgi:cathepsin B
MNIKLAIFAITSIATLGLLISHFSSKSEIKQQNKYQIMASVINSKRNGTWKANEDLPASFLSQVLKRSFSLQVEAQIPAQFDQTPIYETQISDQPDSLDLREKFPQCESIKEIRDQSACGSCWAFGAASSISDRLCIASDQKDQRKISTEELIECCRSCGNGCNGGYLYTTWIYWKIDGIVTGDVYGDTKTCKPYAFPPCNHHSAGPFEDCSKFDYKTPKCKRECSNSSYGKSFKDDKIYGEKVYALKGEENIIQDLNTYGSVEVAFQVYEDFLLYKSGVYQHTQGKLLGGHAVKAIGYGIENGTKYWLIANSWNENWGDKGTFKILRGQNHCDIENSAVAGIPRVN